MGEQGLELFGGQGSGLVGDDFGEFGVGGGVVAPSVADEVISVCLRDTAGKRVPASRTRAVASRLYLLGRERA